VSHGMGKRIMSPMSCLFATDHNVYLDCFLFKFIMHEHDNKVFAKNICYNCIKASPSFDIRLKSELQDQIRDQDQLLNHLFEPSATDLRLQL
jgi:hypothetical protein